MAMANAVQKLADKTPGKEARAMEGFARALRQVIRTHFRKSVLILSPSFLLQLPTIIADNAGYDSSQLVSELRALHSEGKTAMGLGEWYGGVQNL